MIVPFLSYEYWFFSCKKMILHLILTPASKFLISLCLAKKTLQKKETFKNILSVVGNISIERGKMKIGTKYYKNRPRIPKIGPESLKNRTIWCQTERLRCLKKDIDSWKKNMNLYVINLPTIDANFVAI